MNKFLLCLLFLSGCTCSKLESVDDNQDTEDLSYLDESTYDYVDSNLDAGTSIDVNENKYIKPKLNNDNFKILNDVISPQGFGSMPKQGTSPL